jgi:carbonic anhydrase
MRKLIKGIMQFRRERRAAYREVFAQLALGQRPDMMLIFCSDSRVAVNTFASTDPGDAFVVRNVGNLIPPTDEAGRSVADESEASALEFAIGRLEVSHIIVCGHSDCGAIKALCAGRSTVAEPHLRAWLRHAEPALAAARAKGEVDENSVSRLNVMTQLEHIAGYPVVRERMARGRLQLHGLWFDIPHLDVYWHDPERGEFVLIDDEEGDMILKRLKEKE